MTSKQTSENERAYNRELSKRIAHAIHMKGWTYRECGEAVGASENTVYRWTENKNPTVPRPYKLAKLCVLLRIDANELLGIRRPR